MQRFTSVKGLTFEVSDTKRRIQTNFAESVSVKRENGMTWTCDHCTYENQPQKTFCLICGKQRSLNSQEKKVKSCPRCTLENAITDLRCQACETIFEETKENIINRTINHLPPMISTNQVAVTKLSTKSEPEKFKIESYPNSSKSDQPPLTQSVMKRPMMNLIDLCTGENDFEEMEDSEVSEAESIVSRNRNKNEDRKGIAEEPDEDDLEYDYSEDGTYVADSQSAEDSESAESSDAEIVSDEDELLDTPPNESNITPRKPLSVAEIDQFETESDISVSEIFRTSNIPSNNFTSSSSKPKKSVQQFLTGRPMEIAPSHPQVTPHFWSVKYLSMKGACAIDFNEFTLDKGATNPNSCSTALKKNSSSSNSKQRSKAGSMNEMYDQQRLKREKNPTNKQRQEIMQQLQTSGSMVAPTEPKEKQKKSKTSRKRTATAYDDAEFAFAANPKKAKTKKRRKSSGGNNWSSYGEWSSSRGSSSGGRARTGGGTRSRSGGSRGGGGGSSSRSRSFQLKQER